MSTETGTIYLTHNTGPFEASTHFTITRLPGTHHAMVTQTVAGARTATRKEIVNLGVINGSIVAVPTLECSTGFLLRAGNFDLPVTFDQINTLRDWQAEAMSSPATRPAAA